MGVQPRSVGPDGGAVPDHGCVRRRGGRQGRAGSVLRHCARLGERPVEGHHASDAEAFAGLGGPAARDDPVAGEVAVIDLDAARGVGDNTELIRRMVRTARCRVGGGIRTIAAARAWLDDGAARVIIGTAASVEFCSQLPGDRVIAAVDAEHGQDVELRVAGIPMNLPSHLHGQGYLDLGFLILDLHFLLLDLDLGSELVGLLLLDLGLDLLHLHFLLDDRHLLGSLSQFDKTILVSLSVAEQVVSLLLQHALEELDQLQEGLWCCVHVSSLDFVEFS